MRKSIAVGLSAACVFAASEAEARHVWYFGAKADAFIAKYLPNASIPGPINQAFAYGQRRHGWASCNVPAMGARSDGAVSECYVKFWGSCSGDCDLNTASTTSSSGGKSSWTVAQTRRY